MGSVIDLAAYRKQQLQTPVETPELPYVDSSGTPSTIVGTYHVEVYIKDENGKNIYMIEAYGIGLPFLDWCGDKSELKGLIDARRKCAHMYRLMLRVRNSTGLPPWEMLGLHPSEISY